MSTQTLRLAVSQSHTLPTTAQTLSALESITKIAAKQGVDLVLFPEAYIGGYPRTATFGSAIGARHPEGKEQFLKYFKDAVDLGDTPEGAGEKWVRRELERPREGERGDGTREELERVAKETGVFLVVGLIEKCAGTLYCGAVYVCPRLGIVGKRRKVMPTGSERLVWGQGQPSTLRAVATTIKGVKLTLASAICWESYMPLLRQSLYSQNINLYLAPTADGRDTWLPLMRTIACEGRCVVLSANQCLSEDKLPEWITGRSADKAPGATANEDSYAQTEMSAEEGHAERSSGEFMRSPKSGKKLGVKDEDSEIAVADLRETDGVSIPDKSNRRSSGYTKPTPKTRRKSTVTQDGNEIILPGVQEDTEEALEPKEDQLSSYQAQRPWKLRRNSTITDDGNEIALPSSKESTVNVGDIGSGQSKVPSGLFRRRQSTVTEDGHEIILPLFQKASVFEDTQEEPKPEPPKLISRGGSCVISPTGEVLAGPLWDDENGLLIAEVDFDDCLRGRLDLDVGGSYSRNDAFKLSVVGLDLSPPP